MPDTTLIRKVTSAQAGILQSQVLFAQIGGAVLLSVSSLILGGPFYHHCVGAFLVLLLTLVFFIAIYYENLTRKLSLSAARLIQRYRRCLGWLVFGDVLIITGFIGLSGGIIDSHIGFVLLLIPAIVAFVRGGGKTVLRTSLGIILLVTNETIALHHSGYWFSCTDSMAEVFQWVFHRTPIKLDKVAANTNAWFPVAYGFGVTLGVALTFIQDHLSTGRALPDRLTTDSSQKINTVLQLDLNGLSDLASSVNAAHQSMTRLVNLTNEPQLHLSVVHPFNDTVLQAFILASPGVKISREAMVRAAEMVFAIHWLDDMFDHLGYGSVKEGRVEFQTATTVNIATLYHAYGIKMVIDHIKKAPAWSDGVESGLLRVFLGSFCQQGTPDERNAAMRRIRNELDKFVKDEQLRKLINEANFAFLWGTSKTAMSLVVGMFWSPTDPAGVGIEQRSIVFDALFLPLLIWHDLDEEVKRENLSGSGSSDPCDFKKEIEIATGSCNGIVTHAFACGILGQDDSVWSAMKPVLKVFFEKHESRMPNTPQYEEYRKTVRKLIN